jgi:hypothetical protein
LLSRRLNPFSFDVCVVAAFSSCPQPLARSRANVLRHAAALAKDEALRLAPAARHPELPPHVRPSTLHEIDAIGVCWERQPSTCSRDSCLHHGGRSIALGPHPNGLLPRIKGCARWNNMWLRDESNFLHTNGNYDPDRWSVSN